MVAVHVAGVATLTVVAGRRLAVLDGRGARHREHPQPQQTGVYRGLLTFALVTMIVGPVLTWLVLVLPGAA